MPKPTQQLPATLVAFSQLRNIPVQVTAFPDGGVQVMVLITKADGDTEWVNAGGRVQGDFDESLMVQLAEQCRLEAERNRQITEAIVRTPLADLNPDETP